VTEARRAAPGGRPHVLVVARGAAETTRLVARLRAHGWSVTWVPGGEEARSALQGGCYEAMVAPLGGRAEDRSLLRFARAARPAPCVVLLSRAGRGSAAAALRAGAYDVLPHPVDPDRLAAAIARGLDHRRLAERVAELEGGFSETPGTDPFRGGSRAIVRAAEQIRQLAGSHVAVLLVGESGTGKAAAARALHRRGPRRDAPFVTVSCEDHAPDVLERVVFGVEEEGGIPGAVERAEGGTLCLDEISAASQAVQIRLLRLLQETAFERVGGGVTRQADVRLVGSTSRDLDVLVGEGRFRGDLLRSLAIASIVLPPLRERPEDLPGLVDRLLLEANRRHRRGVRSVSKGVLERFLRYAWPGNLRELRDTIERMVVTSPGGRPLGLAEIPPPLRDEDLALERPSLAPGMTVEEAERALIETTLIHVGYDKPRAAAMLGIGVRTLYRKIQEYRLRDPRRG